LLATAAVALALLVDVYSLGGGIAPQSSPYALGPMSVSGTIEGRAAYIDFTPTASTDRHVAKAHAGAR
jgi:hypothetical protein